MMFLLFFSCQNEDLVEESHIHLSKTDISFDQFKTETGLTTFETTIKINQSQLGFQYRNPDGSYELSDFIISTDLIKKVVIDEKTTYTFQVQPVEESYSDRFFNLTMFYKEGWQSLLVELKPTDENLIQLRDGLTDKFEGTMTRLYQSDQPLIGAQGCTTVFITYWHCTGTGQCASGTCDQCELCVSSDSYTMCGSNPTPGNPVLYLSAGPSTGGPSGSSGSGTSTSTINNEIVIDPNIIDIGFLTDCNGSIVCINLENFRQFKLGLTDEQREVLSLNSSFNNSVFGYLSDNQFTDESKSFANQLITTAVENFVTFDFDQDNSESNSLVFNDLTALQDFLYLNSLTPGVDEFVDETNAQGRFGIFKFKIKSFGGVMVKAKIIETPTSYTITNVTSEHYGLTFFSEWNQNDYIVTYLPNNKIQIVVTGVVSTAGFLEGTGIAGYENYLLTVIYDKEWGIIDYSKWEKIR